MAARPRRQRARISRACLKIFVEDPLEIVDLQTASFFFIEKNGREFTTSKARIMHVDH